MFVPFLPMIVALVTLGMLSDRAPAAESMIAHAALWQILVYLMLCFVVGQLPRRNSERPIIAMLAGRRFMILGFWVMMLWSSGPSLPITLAEFRIPYAPELAQVIWIGVYWLGDAISLDRLESLSLKPICNKLTQVNLNMRVQMPVVGLAAIQFVWFQLLDFTLPEASAWIWGLLNLSSVMLILVTVAPWVMIKSWKAPRLANPEKQRIIQDELNRHRVGNTIILAWPEEVIQSITAGVIGFFPHFRYLLVSNQLCQALEEDELRAVIAHEAGHIRRKHMVFFAVGFMVFMQLVILLLGVINGFQIALGWQVPFWFYNLMPLAGLLLFFRYGMGFLSRNFERQADCHALESVGFQPMKQALLKVAWLNGINPEEDNWHHYGIMQRLRFLVQCTEYSSQRGFHHHQVARIKRLCLIMVVLLVSVNTLAFSQSMQIRILEFRLAEALAAQDQLAYAGEEHKEELLFLADQYQDLGKVEEAERLYRKILAVDPENPHLLNNYSWLLSRHYPKDDLRLQQAIEMAQEALKHENKPHIWDTLAEAYAKNGNSLASLEAARNALELAKAGQGLDGASMGLSYYQERLKDFSVQGNL